MNASLTPACSESAPREATRPAPGLAEFAVMIPGPLRQCCSGNGEILVPASSLRTLLQEIERRYPALYRSVCDETGAVRRHVNLFVNSSNIRDCDGLNTPLAAGDVITILPAVSGG